MGVGKTSLGKKLAKKMGYTFFDTDNIIKVNQNKSINELFESKGEVYFRELEREVLTQLSTANKAIVSVGGGLPCFFDNLNLMKETGVVIYLKASHELLEKRLIKDKQKRPLLQAILTPEELTKYITTTLQQREAFYLQANKVVEIDAKSDNEIINELIFQLLLLE